MHQDSDKPLIKVLAPYKINASDISIAFKNDV